MARQHPLGLGIGVRVAAVCVASPGASAAELALTDVSASCGLTFVHVTGGSGEKYPCEVIGAGGGLLDFDGDGDLDLYLVQGAALPGVTYDPAPRNELWENVSGREGPRFRKVADAAGAGDPGYGMGCAVGDVDNDGDPDLFVTNFGRNALYRNDAGRFADVTAAAGVGDERWATSAAFFDADSDGFLDLYVCNYFKFRVEDHGWYGLRKPGYRTFGGPAMFAADPDLLYRNRGDGTFEDVSDASGIRAVEPRHAMGVVAGDFDDDGDQDLYVANDTQPNSLWLNDGSGRFVDEAMFAGVATDEEGAPQAGMGVDAADYDGDGIIDLFCTNFSLETNTLYRGEGGGFFSDVSYAAGVGEASLPFLAFGTGFFDPDNDGDQDLFVANGHIMDNVELYFDNLTFRQRNQLFLNEGGRFREAGPELGPVATREEVSRGALFGDLDGDGDTDLVVTDVGTSPQVIRNDSGAANGWIRVVLAGARSNRDGYGAEVRVTAGGRTRRDQARAAFSYLSSGDPRPLFGLGAAREAERVEVRWPSGVTDRVDRVPAAATVVITEGRGGDLRRATGGNGP
jgi:hypothetical protein